MSVEREVVWTPQATRDLDAIAEYIAADSVDRAIEIVQRLYARAQTLNQFAERGRLVPEMRTIGKRKYRELIENPWRLIYRVDDQAVEVQAVLDGRRDLEQLLMERLLG